MKLCVKSSDCAGCCWTSALTLMGETIPADMVWVRGPLPGRGVLPGASGGAFRVRGVFSD